MPRRRMHIKLLTADYLRYADMRRYLGYRKEDTYRLNRDQGYREEETPVTEEPIKQNWAGSTCTVHRFEEGEYTYLRQPSILNRNWVVMGIERYRSFGVRAEGVMR